jgi:hypothetical protein
MPATSTEQKKSSSAYPIRNSGKVPSLVSKPHLSTHAAEIKSKSIGLFREMVSCDISSFAAQFGRPVWETMPIQFLGRKEFVYQAYVCAFFTAASNASTALERRNKSAWEVRVEECARVDRLDLILQRIDDDTGVLHEPNWSHSRHRIKGKVIIIRNANG